MKDERVEVLGWARRVLEDIIQELSLSGGRVEELPDGLKLVWGGTPPGYEMSVYLGFLGDKPFFSLSRHLRQPWVKDIGELEELLVSELRRFGFGRGPKLEAQ